MLVPLKWLKTYVEIELSPKELADRMTMSGTKVESIEEIGDEIQDVVVGKILEITQHPNADRLLVVKVDTGTGTLQVVTGAKNIQEGDYVPVALVGASLPGGISIGKNKLRGVESYGMLCSAQELALNITSLPKEQLTGIYILDKEYPLGMDIRKVLGLDDVVFEFELTNNRPDCQSIIGIAREVAATLDKKLMLPKIQIKHQQDHIRNYTSIEIQDPDLCQRYTAKMLRNIKIQPSPYWLQERLAKVGIRSINNIVDVTNYIMVETGQPLHAFDYDKLEQKRIMVRRAKEDERLVTLDNIERTLDPSMLVIADGKKAIGIAGIMGGENSEIDENTKNIILESANFDKNSIRLTAKKLGLRTEASNRYEKGLDPNLTEWAMNRAAQLLEEINAGIIVDGFIDIYHNPLEPHYIEVDSDWVNRFIGIQITPEEMGRHLESLGMDVEILNSKLNVKIPTYRQDLQLEEDIAEEIARLYGYDRIPETIMAGITVQGVRTPIQKLEDRIKDVLVAQGGFETITYSFASPQSLERLNIPMVDIKEKTLAILNPLGDENSLMRTTIMDHMLQVINHNINHNIHEGFLYELSNTYHPNRGQKNKLPREVKTLCLGLYGDVDFFHLKGIVENILKACGIKDFEIIEGESSIFHPGRRAQLLCQDESLGIFGEIHPDVAERYGIYQRIYMGEFNFEKINEFSNLNTQYEELPKYPSVTRDFAIIIQDSIPAREVEKIIENQHSEIVESYTLFDVYQGKQIPQGYKSLAYSIIYRKKDGTLTDIEVHKVHNKIISDLQYKLEAKLRD